MMKVWGKSEQLEKLDNTFSIPYHKIMDGQMPSPQNQQPIQTSSPLSQNETPKEKKGLLKTLALLEVGLIEIFFFGIVIVLLFGILNYFNILPLSKTFPNQLGWLPRRDVPTGTSQSNNVTNVAIPPTTALILSVNDQAKQTLLEFLPTILSPSILSKLPSSITLKEDQYNQGRLTTSFNTRDERMGLEFRTSIDLKRITSLDFSFERIQTASPSVELGKATVPQIFSITPKGVWGCKDLIRNKLLYCENFWEDIDTKRGLGFLIITDSLGDRLVFSFCTHTKESDSYSWKSCRSELLKTGVK